MTKAAIDFSAYIAECTTTSPAASGSSRPWMTDGQSLRDHASSSSLGSLAVTRRLSPVLTRDMKGNGAQTTQYC